MKPILSMQSLQPRPIALHSKPHPAGADAALSARDAKLKKASEDLEGAFVQQMYKTMRQTVPSGGMFDGGSGEGMFTSLMDEHVAAETPQHWQHGLGEAVYRQLRGAIHPHGGGSGTPDAAAVTAATGSDAASSAGETGLDSTTSD